MAVSSDSSGYPHPDSELADNHVDEVEHSGAGEPQQKVGRVRDHQHLWQAQGRVLFMIETVHDLRMAA